MSRFLTAAICVCVASSAVAAMGPVTLQGLAEGADLIVYGQVETLVAEERAYEAGQNDEMSGRLFRHVRATVSQFEVIKGSAPDSIIVTAVAGMEDHPDFKVGEQVVLFLVSNEDGETYRTVALAQGKFDVTDGQITREGLSVEEFLSKIRELLRPTPPALMSRLAP